MPELPAVDTLHLRNPAALLLGQVSRELSPEDGMFHGNAEHYLSCGASAYNVISAALDLSGVRPRSMLDFGAGAGRVTRWLRAGHPQAAIATTDIRPRDIAFCQAAFGTRSWLSGIDIDRLSAPETYDLIWVGSVITHLSEENSLRLMRKLFSWLNPLGLLVVSLHGRFVQHRAAQFDHYGVGAGRWADIERDYAARGFGYADYPGQEGYGISLCSPAWMAAAAERVAGARVVLFSERAWDGHHDVVALQNRPVTGQSG
ncbi:class I SAM-dependent methyltransferase [Teichococcus aestuarii]|uniref:class I SAM-dependent methyltransferase n=1 Tax=Teichococcus aestuarii TaxID=568898 RepID=UPI003608C6B8